MATTDLRIELDVREAVLSKALRAANTADDADEPAGQLHTLMLNERLSEIRTFRGQLIAVGILPRPNH
jgi:hypothetical protein